MSIHKQGSRTTKKAPEVKGATRQMRGQLMRHEVKCLDSSKMEKRIGLVIGTRPGIVMFAPIINELRACSVPHFIIHTGQHYSPNMDAIFFKNLKLRSPDYKLNHVSERKTHGAQTAAMLEGIEAILFQLMS